MTEKQQKQLFIQKAVMEVMEKNLSKWQSVKELKKKYDLFVRNIKKIDDYDTILRTDFAPLKEKRAISKKELVGKVFPVTSVLGVFAYDNGDKKMGKLANVKFSELEKMKHNSLVKYSKKILKISGPLIEQNPEAGKKTPKHVIADYGLASKHLDGLQTSLDNCIRNEAGFTEIRLMKNKSKAKLEQRIRDNNVLLKKKLDRMMHLFRDSQKTFYSEYIKSRIPAEPKPVSPADSQAAAEKPVPAVKKPSASAENKPAPVD